MQCPRKVLFAYRNHKEDDWRDDDTCSYCGSLNPETLMARLEKGDIEMGPTDKSYKAYIHNKSREEGKELMSDAQKFADYLNSLLALDPAWVKSIIEHRPPCNKPLADHPTLPAWPGEQLGREQGTYAAGALGLMNGFFYPEVVRMEYEDKTGEIIRFSTFERKVSE